MNPTILNNANSLSDNFREDRIHTFYIRFIEAADYEDVNGQVVVIT
jgi:nicotinamidase-related amidase